MAEVGTAYLNVQPSLGGFSSALDSALAPITSKFEALAKNKAALGLAGVAAAAGVAGKALYDLGSDFDAAYDKIRVSTGATGRELEGLKNDFREVVKAVPTDFSTASDAIGQLNQRLGLTGKPLQEMAKQLLELSRLTNTDLSTNIESVSRAFVDWEVPVKDQSKTLDGFFRIAQASGATVGDLTSSVQKFGSPLRQLGFTLEEAGSMFAVFERAGVNTETMVPGLKLAISNLTRPTEDLGVAMAEMGIKAGDPEKALRQVFALLSSGSPLSDIEKTGLAMDVFGKRAGSDMAEAIKQGRFELGDMLEIFKDGDGGTILDTAEDTNDLGENMKILGNNIKIFLEPVATTVFEKVNDAVLFLTRNSKWALPLIGGLVAALSVMVVTSGIKMIATWAATTLASLRAAGAMAASVARQVAAWVLLGAQALIQGARIAAGWILAMGPVAWIGLAVAALAALIILKWDWVSNALTNTWNWIKQTAVTIWNGIKDFFIQWWPLLLVPFTGGMSLIVGFLIKNWDVIRDKIVGVWNSIKDFFGNVWDAIKTTASNGVQAVVNTVANFVSSAAAKALNLGQAIFNGVRDGLAGIVGFVTTVAKGAVNALVDAINAIKIPSIHIGVNMPHPLPDIDFNTPEIDPFPNIPRLASGTSNWPGGWSWVGEEGPELMNVPQGAAVLDAKRSRSLMRNGGRRSVIDGDGARNIVNNYIQTVGSGNPDPGVFFFQIDSRMRAMGMGQ